MSGLQLHLVGILLAVSLVSRTHTRMLGDEWFYTWNSRHPLMSGVVEKTSSGVVENDEQCICEILTMM